MSKCKFCNDDAIMDDPNGDASCMKCYEQHMAEAIEQLENEHKVFGVGEGESRVYFSSSEES